MLKAKGRGYETNGETDIKHIHVLVAESSNRECNIPRFDINSISTKVVPKSHLLTWR